MTEQEKIRAILQNVAAWGYGEGGLEELLVILARNNQIDQAVGTKYPSDQIIAFQFHLTEEGLRTADAWQKENEYKEPEYDENGWIWESDTWESYEILCEELGDALDTAEEESQYASELAEEESEDDLEL